MINSVLKALDILSSFSASEPRLTLGELRQRLGLPKSTVHNLLMTLAARGFVEKVDNDHYALGTAIIPLTQAVRVNAEIRDRAAPLLRELADACRESAMLAVLDGDYCLYIYAIESPRRLLARTAVGDRVHLHCTSLGKAMLAYLAQQEVETIVARTGLPAFTPNTITSLPALFAELERTRQQGYATDNQEHEPGTFCVGAPIFNERGRVIAACSVSGLNPDITGGRVDEFSQRVKATAQEISRRMGYVPPRRMVVTPSMIVYDKQTTPVYTGRDSA